MFDYFVQGVKTVDRASIRLEVEIQLPHLQRRSGSVPDTEKGAFAGIHLANVDHLTSQIAITRRSE